MKFVEERLNKVIDLDLVYYTLHENDKVIYLDGHFTADDLRKIADALSG